MAISEETAGHRATLRVLAILDALAANQRGLTMAEICRELGAPKSSLFPILHTMADTEYIAYDEDTMRYSIGLRTYLLSKAFDRGAMGLPLIEGEMRRVVGTCNETCQAGTLDHGRVLYIARVDSPQRIRLSSEIGKTLPAHCTAIGKAILSQLSDAEAIDSLVLPLERPTEHAVKTPEELLSQLAETRATGFAHDRQEVLEGVECLAVPIRRSNGHCFGMSVSVPAYRLDAAKKDLIKQALSDAKDRLEAALI